MFAAFTRKSLYYLLYILAGVSVSLLSYSFIGGVEVSNINLNTVVFASSENENVDPLVLGAFVEEIPVSKAPSTFSSQIYNSNYRAYVFDKYFEKNNSPLQGYGKNFVEACIRYGAPDDCLLMVAIAKAETNLCKTDISDLQKNCWGFGGAGSNRIVWPSYEVSIDEVTRRVMEGYGTRFFNDANNGKLYYCGRHCTKWGNVVNSYKYEINEFGISLGFPSML
ncbi:hypothetical protein JW796_03485 [Candidatus Dojkabacteria bacterium]|nr:hypothetical protein [Candidatus Dojkabacteria bacterium]